MSTLWWQHGGAAGTQGKFFCGNGRNIGGFSGPRLGTGIPFHWPKQATWSNPKSRSVELLCPKRGPGKGVNTGRGEALWVVVQSPTPGQCSVRTGPVDPMLTRMFSRFGRSTQGHLKLLTVRISLTRFPEGICFNSREYKGACYLWS